MHRASNCLPVSESNALLAVEDLLTQCAVSHDVVFALGPRALERFFRQALMSHLPPSKVLPCPRVDWDVSDDGVLSIETPGLRLSGAYPAWNEKPLRPITVVVVREIDQTTIRYHCVGGVLVLQLSSTGTGLTVSAKLLGFPNAPGRLLVIGPAKVEGAARWAQNGQLHPRPALGDAPIDDDYAMVNALIADDGTTLAFGPRDLRRFRVAGRVTGRDTLSDGMHFSMGYHLESLAIPQEGLDLPALYVTSGTRPFSTLRGVAAMLAVEMNARRRFGPGNHWCSWYSHYFNFSRNDLEAFLVGLKTAPQPTLRAVQIDAGYFTAPGDWLSPNEKWPGGLEPAFARIAEAGFMPGVWIAPYMAGNRSKIIAENPEWILRRHDGTPMLGLVAYGEEKTWGYPDEEWYVLDSSHPGVTAHIVHCLRTLRGWGARFFKTDFLFWALFEPGDDQVRRHRPGLTSIERMRALLAAMREAMGEDSFWLGCLAPFPPMIGFADAMRTGGDNASHWPMDPDHCGHSALHLIRSSWAMQFANGVLWQNDADALILRNFHTDLTPNEVVSLALWVAALGGAVNTSDSLAECPPERQTLWRFCTQGPAAGIADLPYWGMPNHPLPVIVRPYPTLQAWAVLTVNISNEKQYGAFTIAELTGSGRSVKAACWGPDGIEKLEFVNEITASLQPHHHRLWWVTESGDPPPVGFTLGGALELLPS